MGNKINSQDEYKTQGNGKKTFGIGNIAVLILIIFSVLLLVLSLVFMLDFLSGSLKEDITIDVPEGAGTIQVAYLLEDQGAISHHALFEAAAQMSGADRQWQTGQFKLKKGSGYKTLINQLTTPQLADVKVLIPEGKQLKQIAVILDKEGICDRDEFLTACEENDFDYEFLKGTDKEGRRRLEGYLFPDTYYFSENTDPNEVIKTMLDRFDEVLYTEDNIKRAAELGYSFDEMIILASMVESEAALESDRKIVAGIFHNRLNDPDNYPLLQSCVTVEYALGIKKTIISYEDTEYDSPYNTYMYPGLPVGPICCPGEMSLKAALWSEENDYYYFQSDEEGDLHYARTWQEHASIQVDVQTEWETDEVQIIGEE